MKHKGVAVLCEQIRLLREDSRLTLPELAAKVGADWWELADIEAGGSEPSVSLLLSICEATGGYLEMGKVEWNGKASRPTSSRPRV